MPSYPKNYPFYSWIPKPLGIIILLFFFLPILTVGGVYSVNSTEMMSGLGIISEHIQFANFVTSIGMAAFAPFLYQLVCVRREKMMCIVGFAFMDIFSYMCQNRQYLFAGTLQPADRVPAYGTDDGQSVHAHLVCRWNGSYPQYYSELGAERYCRLE